ncbi:MAG: hypothetical protein KC535_02235 [Nanoarchaeota archaeon]|nr:hypothetical protein [Nanoarchaeota archaeon]
MKRFTSFLLISVFMVLLLSSVGLALPTRVNITMYETVYQNVTFAKDFYLTENTEYCTIAGILNVSNPSPDTVNDIYLNYTFTQNMNSTFVYDAGRFGVQVQGVANGTDNPFVVHIPELLSGESSQFTYNVSCDSVPAPMNINTTYENFDHGFTRKVLAGENWTITQRVTNDFTQSLNNINVSITAQNVSWNGTNDNFLLAQLNPVADYSNVSGNGTSTTNWYWQVNGGTLTTGSSANITYIVTAPDNVPTSDTYMAILERLTYDIGFLASNITLTDVLAKSQLDFNVEKRIIQPADNENNTNVTWEANADVSTPINISYNLTAVSLWVTETLDPSNKTTSFGTLEQNYVPGFEVNLTNTWTTAGSAWDFNFTDGSSALSPPPIVWMRPYFNLRNAQGQILNSSVTQSGNDIYMKYIYVINGYWLQIDKNITSIATDSYRIDIFVENIGNAWTPQNLVVTAYDYVPAEFAAFNFSDPFDASASSNGSGFNGTSYRWTIPVKSPYNSSLGPSSETLANRSWSMNYFVNGTGDYRLSDLYIVGLDPRQVDGAGTHEGIAVFSNFITRSSEFFYVFIVLFLIVLNIINFMYTRKIADKLK